MTAFLWVLGFVCKLVLWLLLAVVVLLLLVLILPISVTLRYEKQMYVIKVRWLGISMQVYPVPSWIKKLSSKKQQSEHLQPEQSPQKEKQPHTTKKTETSKSQPLSSTPITDTVQQPKTQAKEQGTSSVPELPQTDGKKVPKPEMPKPSKDKVNKVAGILSAIRGPLALLLKGIWVSVWVRWPIKGTDAADTALSFGRWNGWIGGVCATLSHVVQFRLRKLDLIPDFQGEYEGEEMVQLRITAILGMALVAVIFFLKRAKEESIF